MSDAVPMGGRRTADPQAPPDRQDRRAASASTRQDADLQGLPASSIGVVIASRRRPDDVAALLRVLEAQTRPPDAVVLSVVGEDDIPRVDDSALKLFVVTGEGGLPRQRNAGLRQVASRCDVVAFLDDDFLPADTYLERMLDAFRSDPDLVAADGVVLFDGASGPGIEWKAAARIVAAAGPVRGRVDYDHPGGLYGCNMSFRTAVALSEQFDERLPLYAWLEDLDMGTRVARHGRVGRVTGARGVHLGVKRGRTSGLRLGYSQIANPLYLWRKGTLSLGRCLRHLLVRTGGNVWGTLRRDRYVDRPGRLLGNLRGLRDAVLRRDAPENVSRL